MGRRAQNVTQIVTGEGNIFSGTGDVYVIHQPLPVPLEEVRTRQHLRILLNKVKAYWIQGVLDRSVHAAAWLELGKQLEPQAVAHPWERVLSTPGRPVRRLKQQTGMLDLFEQSGNTLLIMGEPGSGKTTTLLELARDLIARVEQEDDFSRPIPVIFHLSTWAEKQQPLREWMAAELSSKYQIPGRIGRTWLENHRLLPLLDGLDEVGVRSRAACVTAINDFGETFGITGLAICSRTREYTDLPVRLRLNAAISLQPLALEQVDGYLAAAGSQLKGLRSALQADKDLQSLARSPLILSIMCLAYQDVSEHSLAAQASGTLEERRKRLLNAYIEHMFARRGAGRHPYAREQTEARLSWLARMMSGRGQTLFLIERLQPSWLEGQWEYTVLAVLGGILFFGLLAGLVAGLGAGLSAGLRDGVWGGLIAGFSAAAAAGVIAALLGGFFSMVAVFDDNRIQPAETLSWSWERARENRSNILAGGLGIGLLSGWGVGLESGFLSGLIGGLFSGAAAALGIAMFAGLVRGQVETTARPNQGIWLSARNAIVFLLFVIPVGVLIAELRVRLVPELGSGYELGTFLGFIVLFGLLYAGGTAYIQHFVLRAILWRRGRLPWRLARFLDFASELLLLQKIGGGYKFVHALLMEHFADLDAERA